MSEYKQYKEELIIAERLARDAGAIMLKHSDNPQSQTKEDGSPVTIADTEINDLVIKELGRLFPRDGVVGEEASSKDISQDRLWYCDPIDGTKSYRWEVPTAMFSLALVEDGQPVLGVAYEPVTGQMFSAVKGQGASRKGKPIQVSNTGMNGLIAVTSSISRVVTVQPPYLLEMAKQKVDIAISNGAVFKSCKVADGRYAGYIEETVQAHDIAAVEVIVTEAGGKVTNWQGEPLDYKNGFTGAILSNGVVHDDLLKLADLGS